MRDVLAPCSNATIILLLCVRISEDIFEADDELAATAVRDQGVVVLVRVRPKSSLEHARAQRSGFLRVQSPTQVSTAAFQSYLQQRKPASRCLCPVQSISIEKLECVPGVCVFQRRQRFFCASTAKPH